MPIIKIQPLDTLFFRDGKPFTMGEDTYANSQKCPNSSVFWGALFTDLLYKGIVSINDVEKLKINNVYLYDSKNYNLLMPSPLDLFQNKDKKVVADKFEFIENARHGDALKVQGRIEGAVLAENSHVSLPENTFITSSAFGKNYLPATQVNEIDLYNMDFIKSYPKIGIGRDKGTRTVSEGQLYRINMQEYDTDWSFILDITFFNESLFPKSGMIRLGGEGKIAHYQVIEMDLIQTLIRDAASQKKALDEGEFFKIYFTAPLIYKMDIDQLFIDDIQLVSVVTGKSIEIGGFDYIQKRPKPMLKAYPAGSVLICYKPEGQQLNSFEIHLAKQLTEHRIYGFNQFFFTKYK